MIAPMRIESSSDARKSGRVAPESEVLATKKFLCLTPPSRGLRALQAVVSRESMPPDSASGQAQCVLLRECGEWIRERAASPARPSRLRERGDASAQRPSLLLSRSLTACGLALPPDDFITWPT